jgi:dihydrofolate synthase / folylpolyglutamate synthase
VFPKYLDFLYRLGEFNIKLGLDTIRSMLNHLGNPHNHPRIIHIAGTNGKGSTLKTIEKLLVESGYRTGSTVSPHLVSFNERFRINGCAIDDERLNAAFRQVCKACDIDLNLSSPRSRDGSLQPTFFEFALAMAFVLFKAAGVDFILLETGLGGRLDATNVIENPLACVITRIALDHQEYLGDTINQIALEKLGILKTDTPVFIARQQDSVSQLIQSHCQTNGYTPVSCPEDFFWEEKAGLFQFSITLSGGSETVNSQIRKKISPRQVGLMGAHQNDNIVTALAVYTYSVTRDRQLDDSTIARIIENLSWKGRLQYLGEKNEILLDGAHNASGMRALLSYLSKEHAGKRILFALGWMKNKDLLSVFDLFPRDNITFIPMEIDSDRAENGEVAYSVLKNRGVNVCPVQKPSELVMNQMGKKLPDHDLLVVAGSLYLVGAFLAMWEKGTLSY